VKLALRFREEFLEEVFDRAGPVQVQAASPDVVQHRRHAAGDRRRRLDRGVFVDMLVNADVGVGVDGTRKCHEPPRIEHVVRIRAEYFLVYGCDPPVSDGDATFVDGVGTGPDDTGVFDKGIVL